VTEATLLTLTSLCPDVRDITVDSLIDTVTESWPRFTSISIDYNVSFTDKVLREVVDHCPNLRQLDLSEKRKAAVLEIVTSRRFGILECPVTFSAEGLERFQAAVKVARKW
jgi:hypothetical protein